MKELQMLINKWQLEADDIKSKNGAAVNFAAMPIAAEWRRLRKCINEAQLLFDEKFGSDTPPQLNKHDVSGRSEQLPNGIDAELLNKLLKFSSKYELSIQFWPEQTAVYISKDGVDLQDYGGSFKFAVGRAIEYLERIAGGNCH